MKEQGIKIKDLVNQALLDFGQITDAQWSEKESEAKWSKKEILGHLIDSASNNLRRLIVGQYEQGTKIVYHQDEWVAYQKYQQMNVDDLKLLWKVLNNQLVVVIDAIPQDKLENICDTGKGKIEMHTLNYFIDDYVLHLDYHLKQIVKGKGAKILTKTKEQG